MYLITVGLSPHDSNKELLSQLDRTTKHKFSPLRINHLKSDIGLVPFRYIVSLKLIDGST